MSDQKLRKKIIRLAYEKPELRKDLMPVLKEAYDPPLSVSPSERRQFAKYVNFIRGEGWDKSRYWDKALLSFSRAGYPGHAVLNNLSTYSLANSSRAAKEILDDAVESGRVKYREDLERIIEVLKLLASDIKRYNSGMKTRVL